LLVFCSGSTGSKEHKSDDGDDVKSSPGTEEGSTCSSLAFVTENYRKNVSSMQLYSKTPIIYPVPKSNFKS
jgi:hypothetical protein